MLLQNQAYCLAMLMLSPCFAGRRYMRAVGTNGTILALGDASTIQGVKMPTTGQVRQSGSENQHLFLALSSSQPVGCQRAAVLFCVWHSA